MPDELDVTNLSVEELQRIQSNVLRQLAVRIHAEKGQLMAPHDSHSSNHSKNSVTLRPGEQVRPDIREIVPGPGETA